MTSPSPNRTYQRLRAHLAYLKLDAAADALAVELDTANHKTHVEFLERLLAIEVEATSTRRREARRRLAGLPAAHRIDDFDFDAQPDLDPTLIADLATLRFMDKHGNVLFIGPPETG
jgi:DNA replication protein DnaC